MGVKAEDIEKVMECLDKRGKELKNKETSYKVIYKKNG
jgi:hypothetical protein